MSRYGIEPLDNHAGKEVVVGWASSMRTFFAMVEDPHAADDENIVVFWIGGAPGEITTIDILAERLSEWAAIPDNIREALHEDYVFSLDIVPAELQRTLF